MQNKQSNVVLSQSYLKIRTTKRSETSTINYRHSGLSLSKVASLNSKLSFSGVSEGVPSIMLKNIVKIQYLDRNKLAARTLFRVFIAHQGLHDAHSPDSKAREQLVPFPRKKNLDGLFDIFLTYMKMFSEFFILLICIFAPVVNNK